ncbi:MAG TPA: permease [Negativicutes bacterium]|nr:permease [Negativicutes bacterium]
MESTTSCGCSGAQTACCSQEAAIAPVYAGIVEKYKLKELLNVIIDVGLKKVLLYFSVFAAIGFFINKFVPADLIFRFFNPDNIFAVPISALVGLPLYVSGSSSLPIIKVLLEGGASEGAMLAFMITGPATSAGAIAGIATIMGKKALALYIAYILAGGIILGYLYNFLLMFLL